ncbi:hypothetical protein [Chelatococcus reniformis]|uniref:Uncharacterized protein n=1 Tax=Chelatococcus reniformis TaxID=1494448 RepID=A0A916XGV0_9HYPH|nr:hypothetical protein [Chelatococcus reniformis]GGC71033.1 hypothetical protein GCM10010994_31950 [Chelatococcus reniformis]
MTPGEAGAASAAGVLAIFGLIHAPTVAIVAMVLCIGIASGTAAVLYARWDARRMVREAVGKAMADHIARLHEEPGEVTGAPPDEG